MCWGLVCPEIADRLQGIRQQQGVYHCLTLMSCCWLYEQLIRQSCWIPQSWPSIQGLYHLLSWRRHTHSHCQVLTSAFCKLLNCPNTNMLKCNTTCLICKCGQILVQSAIRMIPSLDERCVILDYTYIDTLVSICTSSNAGFILDTFGTEVANRSSSISLHLQIAGLCHGYQYFQRTHIQ